MSKKQRILCVGVLIVAVCMLLVSCNSTDKIDDFRKKLEDAGNFEIVVTMEVPTLGEIVMYSKIEGSKVWASSFMDEPETYSVINDEVVLLYTKTDTGWEKTFVTIEKGKETMGFSLLEGGYYEYSITERAYVSKSGANLIYDGVVFDFAKLTLNKNSAKIEGVAVSDGVKVRYTIEYKNVGTTKVDLPM